MGETKKREQWGSKLGFILAASGSAIGLGNIWKFPYITGQNGGSAFIIIYLIAIAIVGFPVMLSEFLIGRKTQKDAVNSFKALSPEKPWFFTGYMGVAAAFMILSFYGVVAGWTMTYTWEAVSGNLLSLDASQFPDHFGALIGDPVKPILWQVAFMVLTVAIVLGGVKKGIERWSKILMPLLLILLLIVMFRSITLEGASAGIDFLLKPDFSALTPTSFLVALGHAFFSLSLGMGTMITYGSYLSKDEKLPSAAISVSVADTVIALIAGFAIFPAVFALGMEAGAGPGLLFMTLPGVFQQLPLGTFFATIFFGLVVIAALTSAISILEVPVAFFTEKYNWTRTKATIILGFVITLVGMAASLSMGPWGGFTIAGKNIFDQLDWVSANILLPLGGLFILLFVGFGMKLKEAFEAADFSLDSKFGKTWMFTLRFVAPGFVLLVFLNALGVTGALTAAIIWSITLVFLYLLGVIGD